MLLQRNLLKASLGGGTWGVTQNVRIVDEKGQCVLHQSIKNGTLGTLGILEKVSDAGDVVIRLDSKDQGVGKNDDKNHHGCDLRAQFNIKDYNHINHGYALTTHKSQGQTVDFGCLKIHGCQKFVRRHDTAP